MIDLVAASVFYQVAALLVLAAFIGLLGTFFRQPLIVSFIAVGIIAGPSVTGLARAHEPIELLAELGIAVLLFLVGLKLDIKLVRTLGPIALIAGLGQIAFTAGVGYLLSLQLGIDPTASIYIAIALAFSSTIIVVKMLSDRREIDSLHGRIALGILVVQDLVVVLAMIAMSAAGVGGGEDATFADVGLIVVYGVVMLALVALFMRYLADSLVQRLASSPELLVCFAIGWAALLAAVGDYLGFSKELGGLLAGVSLASTSFREAIAARLAPLRDFLLLFFFVALGAQIDLSLLGQQILPALVLSVFVLIGKPLVVLVLSGLLGYRKRTGFLAGLTLSQISEFSLIFMAMGVALGQLGVETLGLVTLVGLLTIAVSTYGISYGHQLYLALEGPLRVFERRGTPREKDDVEPEKTEKFGIVVFGLGRFGGSIGRRLEANGQRVLGIDFNPLAVKRWRQEGLTAAYGDASDPEFISHIDLEDVRWVVTSVPESVSGVTHDDTRLTLIHTLRERGYRGKIAVTSHRPDDEAWLHACGADLVLLPFQDAADRAAELLGGSREQPRLEVIEPEDQQPLAP
ncbi:MAG: cation:proton antiporter family protein [Pseudomonadota bacterium]